MIKENIKTKILRKSPPNFYHFVKEIEAGAKKWFPYKRTCSLQIAAILDVLDV